MAKKESKISINAVDKYLKSAYVAPSSVTLGDGDSTLIVSVKRYLDWNTMTAMIYDAVNAVFFDEDGETVYHPEFEDIAKANAIMTYVANFKNEMSMTRVHEFMYSIGAMESILAVWSHKQHQDFENAFRRCVDSRCEMILSAERAKLNKVAVDLERATESMKAMTDLFSDIDMAKLEEAMNVMTKMNEVSIANALIDARDKDFVEMRKAELSVVE